MPPLLADFSHARACKPFCEKYLTLPIRYDSVCKTAAKIVNIVKVEHTLPLRDGVCSTNAQTRDGSSYLVIRKSGTTVTPHLYSLE